MGNSLSQNTPASSVPSTPQSAMQQPSFPQQQRVQQLQQQQQQSQQQQQQQQQQSLQQYDREPLFATRKNFASRMANAPAASSNNSNSNAATANNNSNSLNGNFMGNSSIPFEASSSPPAFGSPLTPSFLEETYGNFIPDAAQMAMDEDMPSPSSRRKSSNPKKVELVPTVFRWNRGGKNVYVTGTFNNWKGRIPLSRSHDEFTTIVELPPGTHQYKFIVDDDWKFNPDQPTLPDPFGTMNNVIDVTSQYDIENDPSKSALSSSPPGEYGQIVPPLEYGTKPPPVLPPHLLQVILNADQVSEDDPTLLPIPQHVMLNHLYALSIKDGVMVLGVTHRYRKKYVTTVLYKPVFD